MAHTLSTLKRIRQSEKRRRRNRAAKSAVRTLEKRVLAALEKSDPEAARSAYRRACGAIDKAASKGVLHRNTAARQKARLSAKINRMEKKT